MVVILDKELQKEIDDKIKSDDTKAALELVEQKESLKLMKMSKGYNWEIKIFPRELQTDFDWTARMEKLNIDMMTKFGSLTA